MSLSSFEVSMETIANSLSEYVELENGICRVTKVGLDQLVKEQLPHFDKVRTDRLAHCAKRTAVLN